MNLPTWITLSRLLGVPLILGLLLYPSPVQSWLATAIFVLAAGTDWVDGYLARRLNQVTDLGKFLDPLVDKLLVLCPLLSLIELGEVPAWSVALILLRELAIAGWRVNPALQANTVPGANLWGKGKTVMQMVAVACLLAPLPLQGNAQRLALLAYGLAVGLTLVSGLIYIWPSARSRQG